MANDNDSMTDILPKWFPGLQRTQAICVHCGVVLVSFSKTEQMHSYHPEKMTHAREKSGEIIIQRITRQREDNLEHSD